MKTRLTVQWTLFLYLIIVGGICGQSMCGQTNSNQYQGKRRSASVMSAIDSDAVVSEPMSLAAPLSSDEIDIQSDDDATQDAVTNENEDADTGFESAEKEADDVPAQATNSPVNRIESVYEQEAGDIDFDKKRATVVELVERAADFFQKNKDYEVFNAFTHGKDFVRGELYIFAFDMTGVCLAHGEQTELLWQNLIDLEDQFGVKIVKTILKKAKQGGGWVTYRWRGATKISYVKQVKKNNIDIVLGCGYYPHSKSDAVVSLVKGAVSLFKSAIKSGRNKEEVFSTFSYPMGRFIYGDLYLYALDFNGTQMAQGDRPGLIGTNAWSYQAQGKFINQEIIQKLKEGHEGVWVEYVSKNAPKRSYAEAVKDAQGNSYFIACGYYPSANRSELMNLVDRGYEYMKSHGENLAAQNFSDRKDDSFRYGDLFLIVYDMTGKCIAHGGNPDYIGQNFYNEQDQDGKYPVREMINKAKRRRAKTGGEVRGGWVNYKIKNSFISEYVKPIRLGLKDYIITCGMYPITKQETMTLLIKSGVNYLKSERPKDAFRAFVKPDGKFLRGDLNLFVFAGNGICLAYGDNYNYIWQNMIGFKDDRGMPYVQTIINTARAGSGKVTYTIDKDERVVLFERVETAGRSYVIGSGYFK